VVLFGVPFSFGKRRGGLAVQFGISVGDLFHLLDLHENEPGCLATNGDLQPSAHGMARNLIFLAGGIVNIIRIQK